MRSVVVHTFYVDVATTATMYLGTTSAVALHGLVLSTTASWDAGTVGLLLLVASSYSWSKENHVDDANGVNTMTSSVSLLASVVLVVVSEVMLFVSILWSVILSLVAHSIYATGGVATLATVVVSTTSSDAITVYSNTLTLLNSTLLLTSGVVSVGAIHSMAMKTPVLSSAMLAVVVVLGTVFLMVQCCEYLHLYWCIYSSGVAGLLYVTTGVHGGHVLLGMLLLLVYDLQSMTLGVYNANSTDAIHGVLGIVLY